MTVFQFNAFPFLMLVFSLLAGWVGTTFGLPFTQWAYCALLGNLIVDVFLGPVTRSR